MGPGSAESRLEDRGFPAVPWTIWEVLLLAPTVLSGVARGLIAQGLLEDSPPYAIFNELAYGCLLLLPFVVIMVRRAKPFQLGLHFRDWKRYAAIGFLSYFVAAPAVFATNYFALKLFEGTPHAIEDVLRKSPTVTHFMDAAVMAVIVAPILEELGFRGVLLPYLRSFLGAGPAIWISAGIFAIAHMDAWPAPIALFILALFLGYLAHWTTSLVASIVLHATFNAASLALLLLMILSGN
jgi:membrane protease YdiL (CAAX protease family)